MTEVPTIYRTGFKGLYKNWLIFVLVLYAIAPINLSITDKIFGIILFLIIFFPVFLAKDCTLIYNSPKNIFSTFIVLFMLLIQFFAAEYAARFYTSTGLFDSLINLVKGVDQYRIYQNHFRESNLNEFSLLKLPAILCMAVVKSCFVFSYSCLINGFEIPRIKLLLSLSIIPFTLFSISRGTFFEIFEAALAIYYFFYIKGSLKKPKLYSIKKKNIIFIVFGFVLIMAFFYNSVRRYDSIDSYRNVMCATSIYCFREYGISFYLEKSLYTLSVYFSMGIFFISKYLLAIFSGEMLGSLIPLVSTSLFGFYDGGLQDHLCSYYVDCKAVWMAEIINWIALFGLIFVPIAIWLFLKKVFKIEALIMQSGSIFSLPLIYYILVYIVSLPVGKFYTVSSSNILGSLFFLLLWLISTRVINRSSHHLETSKSQ